MPKKTKEVKRLALADTIKDIVEATALVTLSGGAFIITIRVLEALIGLLA